MYNFAASLFPQTSIQSLSDWPKQIPEESALFCNNKRFRWHTRIDSVFGKVRREYDIGKANHVEILRLSAFILFVGNLVSRPIFNSRMERRHINEIKGAESDPRPLTHTDPINVFRSNA